MLFYLLSSFILIVAILLYFRLAEHFKIIDKPNSRSSHKYPTIRGGGIIFPLASLIWFITYGADYHWQISGLMLIALVSFMDDIWSISRLARFVVHIIAVCLLLIGNGFWSIDWYWTAIALFVMVFWLNAFNFMDGINGITPFYALVALLTFSWINQSFHFYPQELIYVLIIAVLIFSYFNARTFARTFAGDVGSISLAFILGWMMLTLILQTGRIEYIILFLVYFLDTTITILFRIKKRENIFKAHRSHLYQVLSNELKLSHIKVSLLYACIQILINLIALYMIKEEMMNIWSFITLFIISIIFYLTCHFYFSNRIKAANIS